MIHIIITGHSKGLGAGITLEMLHENHHIHGVSRTDNIDIQKLAAAKGCAMDFYPCDLSHTDEITPVMQQIFLRIKESKEEVEGIYLINNAGIIHPIGTIASIDPAEIDQHIRINLLAPMIIIREFISLSAGYNTEKRILNISSGAAQNPYHGWSNYSTGKAGLDMFTRCVALEQEDEAFPVKLMAVAPGIIDTDMQTTIRSVPDGQFVHKDFFVELKETGKLVPPSVAGKHLKDLLFSPGFKNGTITDIRDQY